MKMRSAVSPATVYALSQGVRRGMDNRLEGISWNMVGKRTRAASER